VTLHRGIDSLAGSSPEKSPGPGARQAEGQKREIAGL